MRKSIILSLFLLLFSVTAYAEYSDMPYDWSYESMSWAVENGIINGSDGKIYPDGYMTRAEQAAVLARYARQNELFAENGEAYTYTDADESDWFYADVCYMSAANIMNGDGERFRPHDNVTREEAVAAMGRMLSIEEDEEACQTFSDIDEIAAQCKFSDCTNVSEPGRAVRKAIEDGIIDINRLESYKKIQKELNYSE